MKTPLMLAHEVLTEAEKANAKQCVVSVDLLRDLLLEVAASEEGEAKLAEALDGFATRSAEAHKRAEKAEADMAARSAERTKALEDSVIGLNLLAEGVAQAVGYAGVKEPDELVAHVEAVVAECLKLRGLLHRAAEALRRTADWCRCDVEGSKGNGVLMNGYQLRLEVVETVALDLAAWVAGVPT